MNEQGSISVGQTGEGGQKDPDAQTAGAAVGATAAGAAETVAGEGGMSGPDSIAPGHNPDGLTNALVGHGFRLLDQDEVFFGARTPPGIIQMHESGGRFSDAAEVGGWHGDVKANTYRTRLSRAELRAARGLPPEADPEPPAEADPMFMSSEESYAAITKLKEERDKLTAELASSKAWQDDHLRILEVSNQHFREALAKVRHLWPESDTPGIDGICTKLAETKAKLELRECMIDNQSKHCQLWSEQLLQAQKERDEARKQLSDLQRDSFSGVCRSLRHELDAANKRVAELEDERQTNIANRLGIQSDLCDARKRIGELESHIVALQQNYDKLYNVTDVAKERDALKAENEQLKQGTREWGKLAESAKEELAQCRRERHALQGKIDRLPANWFEDSSLETWFPFTAKEFAKRKQQLTEKSALCERLACGIQRILPEYGAWESTCPFCGRQVGSGPLKHRTGCIVLESNTALQRAEGNKPEGSPE